MYFVIFCNLINILDVGADSSDAVKIKIEIRGFLQLRKPTAVTALQKLLSPFAPALSGCWERCVGGLFGHAGYTECITVLGDSLKCNKCNKCSYHISAQQKKN